MQLANHSVFFFCHTSPRKWVFLIVYVNDIVINNATIGITKWAFLRSKEIQNICAGLNYLLRLVCLVIMQASLIYHWNVVIHILIYHKKSFGQGLLYEDKESI